MDLLNEAAQQRNLYSIGATVSRRVAAAAATAVYLHAIPTSYITLQFLIDSSTCKVVTISWM